jgi:hypothetical protein
VRAQGEARAAELIGEALRSNKGFLQLRRLEAARDIANLLSTSNNRMMLDSQSLLLNGQYSVNTPFEFPIPFSFVLPANTVAGNDAKELLNLGKK